MVRPVVVKCIDRNTIQITVSLNLDGVGCASEELGSPTGD